MSTPSPESPTAKSAASASPANASGLDESGLRGLLGYQLRRAELSMQQAFVQRVAKPLALRQVEFSVLMLLAKNNRVTHKQLSTALAVAPSNMVGVVAGLERRHLIERVSNPADGRSFFWRLTDGGDKLQRCALETVSAMEADLLADWPRPERAEAHALLERLWTD